MMFLIFVMCLAFAGFAQAQDQSGSVLLQLAAEQLPRCALQCTLTTVGASACKLTDMDCIKQNTQLLNDLSICVKSNCKVKEALSAKKFLQDTMGEPIRDKTEFGTVVCSIGGAISVLFYLLRVTARLPVFGGKWGPDDWTMTLNIILTIPLTFCAYLLNQLGMGRDMWQVPFENITKILEIFYITELLYLTAIGVTKISILQFYLRLFPHKSFRRMIHATIILCILYIIGFVLATALQCVPIRISWERWDGEHHGKCFNLNLMAWISAAANIVLDLIVLMLPMRELKNLNLSPLRKFGVIIMFLGGGFVTIISVLRLKEMVQFANTTNVTWDYMHIGLWSAVEAQVSVIFACLPAIRSLQLSIRNKFFPKSKTRSSCYMDDSNLNSKRPTHRSKVDEDDLLHPDEYEMSLGDDAKEAQAKEIGLADDSSERSLTRSAKAGQEVVPSDASRPSTGQPFRIMVHTEFSVEAHGSQSLKDKKGGPTS